MEYLVSERKLEIKTVIASLIHAARSFALKKRKAFLRSGGDESFSVQYALVERSNLRIACVFVLALLNCRDRHWTTNLYRPLKRAIEFFLFCQILVCAQRVLSESQVQTNLEVIEALFSKILLATLAEIDGDSTCLYFEPAKTDAGYNWVIEDEIKKLPSLGRFAAVYRFSAEQNRDSTSWFLLQYNPIDLAVLYQKDKRDSNGQITRLVSCALSLTVYDGDGKVVISKIVNDSMSDNIGMNQIETVENEHYPFTVGPHLRKKFYKSLIEPVLVSVITGGIVYSFYTFRSK
jgi:hypothetical protein